MGTNLPFWLLSNVYWEVFVETIAWKLGKVRCICMTIHGCHKGFLLIFTLYWYDMQ